MLLIGATAGMVCISDCKDTATYGVIKNLDKKS